MSLPMWERGLKFIIPAVIIGRYGSLPMWERGLKCAIGIDDADAKAASRSPCGSVD